MFFAALRRIRYSTSFQSRLQMRKFNRQ